MFLSNWITRRTNRSNQSNKSPKRAPRARLGVETLEQRDLMPATPWAWPTPAGTSVQTVVLTVANGMVQIFDNGVLAAQQAVASASSVSLFDPIAGSWLSAGVTFRI